MGGIPVHFDWLESAVLKRHNREWKLAFLHSTTSKSSKPVNMEVEEAAVHDLLGKMDMAFKQQDVEALRPLYTEDMLSCGSDPTEFFNKQEIMNMWEKGIDTSGIQMIGDPKIKIAPDGNSAFAVEQFFMPIFSKKMAFRTGYHLIKSNGKWLIFSANTACIPKNEDLPKINKAL
jgi:ketosteroid isomerase-like protein